MSSEQLIEASDFLQTHTLFKNSSLKSTIACLQQRKYSIEKRMRRLARDLRRADRIDYEKVKEWVELNKQARVTRIYEAELIYIRNIL